MCDSLVIQRTMEAISQEPRDGTTKQVQKIPTNAKEDVDELMFEIAMVSCTANNTFKPCVCQQIQTAATFTDKNGEPIFLEYPEFVCSKDIRSEDQAAGYGCKQLRSKRVLHRDVFEQRIHVEVIYNAGCELRCLYDNCVSYDPTTTRTSATRATNNHKKVIVGAIDIREGAAEDTGPTH